MTGGRLYVFDHGQEFTGVCGDMAAKILHGSRPGLPDGEAVIHTLGVDLQKQAGIFRPPFHILPDAEPQALLVGVRVVEPGVPVDPADLEDVAGFIQEGFKKVPAQGFHGLVEGIDVLFFMFQEPVPVVVQANAPEKIHSLRGETGKHAVYLFL